MDHKPAHILRYTADKFNYEYGQREVEGKGLFRLLEQCSAHGQLGYLFGGAISGHAIRYLESLGYAVAREESNNAFYVSFEQATKRKEKKNWKLKAAKSKLTNED